MAKKFVEHILLALLVTSLHGVVFSDGFISSTNQCYIYTLSGSGFGSNLVGLLMGMSVWGDPKLNNSMYVDEGNWAYKCSNAGSWGKFFKGDMPQQLPFGEMSKELKQHCLSFDYDSAYNAFVSDAEARHGSFTVKDAFDLLSKATKQLWMLSSSMAIMVEQQWKYYDLLSKPIAGIHIRAGDKSLEDKEHSNWHNRHEWVHNFKKVVSRNSKVPIRTCLLFGDQWAAMCNATRIMHAQEVYSNMHMIGGDQELHMQEKFNEASEQHRCDTTRSMLMELDAMARTDVFVGSMNSNVARLVVLLRTHVYNKSKSTSSDASGGYNWHYDYKRTERDFSAFVP